MTGQAPPSTAVFGYGSLLEPRSLHRTLPEIDLQECIPATAGGLVRCFDVAFPNDGSQADKAYYAADGHRPPRILLCNLRPDTGRRANGVCIPVGPRELAALRDRERRYTPTDITELVVAYAGHRAPAGRVLAFLGRTEFTRAEDAARGVLSAAYRDTILAGAAYWDQRVPGFAADFHAGTHLPAPDRVQPVRQVDLRAP
ncbi:gamma-glutamylcyclotransferase [Ruania zhangjianzhongii]|uniref:gamma-glutamylcyclotransferase n=1 Tax=Ruania zhangjianzhongii TaxID=2603206 RepID=UPI0011C7C900|nr:gamma-glutamylcyclotransferase [Ruania zhangjianzhongii]